VFSQTSSGVIIPYIAFGGSGIEAKVGAFVTPGSTGNSDVTTTGIDPEMVFLVSSGSTATGSINGAEFMFGSAASSTERAACWTAYEDGVLGSAVVRNRYGVTDKVLNLRTLNSSGAVLEQSADLSSMGVGKFTLNWDTVSPDSLNIGYAVLGTTTASTSGSSMWVSWL
jgi:hypothetical protein